MKVSHVRRMEYIALILVFQCGISSSQRNLSPIGTATQSSTYKPYVAALAVTGGPTNNFNSGSCTHTAEWRSAAWWMLTLPSPNYFIEEVTIYYRGDSNGIDGFSLYLSNTSITGTHKQTPPGHLCYDDVADGVYSVIQTIQCSHLAQHVILYNEHLKGFNGPFMELCDVQIIGCSKKWYGAYCKEECSMKCFDQHCYPNNGSCVWGCNCYDDNCNSDNICTAGCKKGFGGQHCNENNLATGGSPEQYPLDNDTPAELAIDGIRIGNSCAKTSGSVAWWLLDLRKQSVIETIYLSFGNDDTVKQHARNHSLYISNSSVTWRNGQVLQMTSNFDNNFPFFTYSIYPAAVGRYIIYEPKAIGETSYVDICEVEVVGCSLGFYGDNCSKTCPETCIGSCNLTTGVCMFGCKDGWMESYCNTSCEYMTFGHECKSICHCYNTTNVCDHVTGTCPEGGCRKGWKGISCSIECEIGQYGYNCNESCDGCLSRQCNSESGECEHQSECNSGWFTDLPFCSKKCVLGTFGKNCSHICHCQTSTYCNRSDGVCFNGGCEKGWQGDNCSTECFSGFFGENCDDMCDTCLLTTCNGFNGSCTYGCIEGYSGEKCNVKAQQSENKVNNYTAVVVGVLAAVIIVQAVFIVLLVRRLKICICSAGKSDDPYETSRQAISGNNSYSTLTMSRENVTLRTVTLGTENDYSNTENVYEMPEPNVANI